MKYVLALDQSTSATKALLFDQDGCLLDKVSRGHRQIYPQPGWAEHDGEEIWQNTLDTIKKLLERNTDHIEDILGLALTNQRETVMVFDRETGKPLHNAIVWQCQRGDSICRELTDNDQVDLIRNKTGLKINTYFSASKLTWLIRKKQKLAQALKKGKALVGTIDTYLIYRLTNCKTFATDHTNASRTLLYDARQLAWSDELCKLFQVPLHTLPEVRESSAVFGETDLSGLLKESIPICGVMGDSQASLFAQQCFEPGSIKITYGTGSSILLNIGTDFKVGGDGTVTALAWILSGKPVYAYEGLINYSAATVSWLKDQMELIEDPSDTEELALSVEDNGGVYLVPAFSGLSAPYWSPEARAAIVGMTAFSTKAHIARAALESIAYQICDVVEMMRKDASVELKSIHCDGAPTRNRFLMQFTADLTELELKVPKIPEMSPLGAVLMSLLGLRVYSEWKDLGKVLQNFELYQPAGQPEQLARFKAGWNSAVERVVLKT